jgi:hypothetical protein
VRRGFVAALVLVAGAACRQGEPQPSAPESQPRPPLALLTGLPLAFGEGFGLDTPRHPVMQRLEQDFAVTLVDGPEQIGPARLLLAAQPRALTADRLVALDRWVRQGGRLVLLADPQLGWPSELPLGDPQRPPYEFSDTGLLAHWGLRLERPSAAAEASFSLGQATVTSPSVGQLRRLSGGCEVAPNARTASCRLGRGRAVIVADADFLLQSGGADALAATLVSAAS